ncbi:late elongated hypocotyl [Artemisia annua]|uniref:Late elongated hypocotyl n=1 Tax=Artemisia annua TaxID=35608 RepID=A0A2U1NBF7_ARTAN|nr:late elongated hypocotyl [Artemisia annua]
MDSYSSGEKHNIKTRKPYTITKQRERWTEDEHNSFLEALKLYGRAWQRIEEHIGTKTAVQIRSHAQKFFTKLEKEAIAKGVPIKQALDIEIPPPRPKRKPNYPYPRKTGPKDPQVAEKDGKQETLISSLQSGIHILDLEKNPLPQTTCHEEELGNETNEEHGAGTEGPSLSHEGPCASSDNENSAPQAFKEFIPVLEKPINQDETNGSFTSIETRKHQKLDKDGINYTTVTSNTSLYEGRYPDKLSQPVLSLNDIRGVQNYPRHVPVQVIDGNQGKDTVPTETSFLESTLTKSGEVHDIVNKAASATTSVHQNNASSYPTFHPLFTPFSNNQENHRSFLHVSSTVSSLIVSSLLQNPAAHAAASFAATFWHPEASSGDSLSRDHPEPPSMAAIAAATVAAATAWWAAHGLLPVCTPFYPGYATSPYSCGTPTDANQERVANNGTSEVVLQEEKTEAEKTQGLPKGSPDQSSSDDTDGKLNTELSPDDTAPVAEVHDSTTANIRKQVDRSSCGSNTTSSSEIETDALEKHGKEKEEAKVSDVNLSCNDTMFRRSRGIINPNESWKEVSEEGRIAFQALFSREVLPQSFPATEKKGEGVSQLDLNRTSPEAGESNGFAVLKGDTNMEEGVLKMGLGSVKLNVHHTGFKPYKRCSIEAKESEIVTASAGSGQNDEKCPKRMRLEAEAST